MKPLRSENPAHTRVPHPDFLAGGPRLCRRKSGGCKGTACDRSGTGNPGRAVAFRPGPAAERAPRAPHLPQAIHSRGRPAASPAQTSPGPLAGGTFSSGDCPWFDDRPQGLRSQPGARGERWEPRGSGARGRSRGGAGRAAETEGAPGERRGQRGRGTSGGDGRGAGRTTGTEGARGERRGRRGRAARPPGTQRARSQKRKLVLRDKLSTVRRRGSRGTCFPPGFNPSPRLGARGWGPGQGDRRRHGSGPQTIARPPRRRHSPAGSLLGGQGPERRRAGAGAAGRRRGARGARGSGARRTACGCGRQRVASPFIARALEARPLHSGRPGPG